MKLLFTFYNHGNYTKIKNGRNFAKKNFFLDIKLIHEVIYFSGIYKLTGHFFLVLDSRALLILLNIKYCSSK